jgi:hypothetical protein
LGTMVVEAESESECYRLDCMSCCCCSRISSCGHGVRGGCLQCGWERMGLHSACRWWSSEGDGDLFCCVCVGLLGLVEDVLVEAVVSYRVNWRFVTRP